MQTRIDRFPRCFRRCVPAAALLYSFMGAAAARAQVPPAVSLGVVGASSVTWNWTPVAGATGYRVLLVSAAGESVGPLNVSGDLTADVNTYTETGLSTNAVYGVIVEAFSAAPPEFAVDSATNTVLTAAAQPSGTMLLGTFNNRVSLSWVTDGNPPGVTYNVNWTTSTGLGVLFSTAPTTPFNVVTGSVSATLVDLPGGQTINIDVEAVNSSGVVSGFDVIVTTTLPYLQNQPVLSSATFANGVSSITWYWSPSTGAIVYQLYSATNGAVSPLLPPTTLSYTQTGLSTNTAYSDYVYAFSVPLSTASAPLTMYTLAAQTTGLTLLGLSVPPAPGVLNPTETISWGAAGNPPGTAYNVSWWTNLTSTITFSTGTTSALVPGLYGGSTIYFTVQAVNFSGSTAPYDSTYFSPSFDVMQSTFFPLGSQALGAGQSGAVTFVVPNAAGDGSGVVVVEITSGTFTVPVTIVVSTPIGGVFPPIVGGVSDLPDPMHLTVAALDSAGVAHQPNLVVHLAVDYAPANYAADETTVDIARFDPVRQIWIPLATSKQGAYLTAATDRLSSFAILSVAAARDLSGITVGPNPLRPLVNPGAVMTFRGLPAACRVRIFSYIGENILDATADGSGVVGWNGRNHVGSAVASGVYIVLIEGAGVKKTMRVAIER
ncbi:MAG: hypothetical protein ACHQ49_05490 [Elusimicrobiota bacterium]